MIISPIKGMEAISVSQVVFKKKYLSLSLFTFFAVSLSLVMITACTDQAKAKLDIQFSDEPHDADVVAEVGGMKLTDEQLYAKDPTALTDLKQQLYNSRLEHLKKYLRERYIVDAAKTANMSVEDFEKKNVSKGEIKISDSKYKQFLVDRHIQEGQINPQIKTKIYEYLQHEEMEKLETVYISKQMSAKGEKAKAYLTKPKVDVEIGKAPVYGKDGAPITVVEFSDFQCPYCSRAAETVNQLKKKYGSKMKLAFRHFPLPMHKDAKPAAEASMCVNEQSSEKFWKFHDLAFKNQDKLDKTNLEKFAKDVGADVKKYNECLDSKKFASFVQGEIEYGEKIGVKSTPTFFVNGQLVSGAVPIETFSEIIEDELNSKPSSGLSKKK